MVIVGQLADIPNSQFPTKVESLLEASFAKETYKETHHFKEPTAYGTQ